MSQKRNWEVIAFVGKSSTPQTIQRNRDEEKFSLGDYVTNGTKMKGVIERFDYSFQNDEVYVYTDWSGVGMNLNSISHAIKLPSAHQIGNPVWLLFGEEGTLKNCEIIKVHFAESKVLYDVEVKGKYYQSDSHPAGEWATRLYNVDAVFVTNPAPKEQSPAENINQIYGIEMVIRNQKNLGWTSICVGSDYIYWENRANDTVSPIFDRRELEKMTTLDLVNKISEVFDNIGSWSQKAKAADSTK